MFVYVPISVHTDRKTQILEHTEAHKCPDTEMHRLKHTETGIQSLSTQNTEIHRHTETCLLWNTQSLWNKVGQILGHTNTDT